MSPLGIAVILIGLLIVLPLLFLIVQYNKLVGLRLRVSESWSNVDTELKRRHDLIPNLVATVQGYATHERRLFEEITRARAQAVIHPTFDDDRLHSERLISNGLQKILAVAEAYPSLRASDNFLQLQRELTTTEDRIQASRRFYNGNVRDYNNQVQQFPSNLVANGFGFAVHAYFEIPSAAERAVPPVGFGA